MSDKTERGAMAPQGQPAWRQAWSQHGEPLRQRWRTWTSRLAPRERRGLAVALAALAVLLVVLLGIRPAWRTLDEAPVQLNQLDAQLQQMNRLAAQAKALRATPAVSSSQSAEGLKAATDRLGASGRLNIQGDRATLTLAGTSPEALTEWLREVRSVARAQVIEAQLTRGSTGFTGSMTLTLGGGGP